MVPVSEVAWNQVNAAVAVTQSVSLNSAAALVMLPATHSTTAVLILKSWAVSVS